MKDIKSYLAMIDPRLLHHINGKSGKFIRIFREQEYVSEEVFGRHLYGKKYNKNNYQELKSRTLKILQALAIGSKPKGNSLVKKKYDICLRNFTIGQKFLNQGVRGEGLRLVKQAHKIAVDFDFTHLACELSSILYHDHIYYHPNSQKVRYYALQSKEYLRSYFFEKETEDHFYQAVAQINNSIKSNKLKEIYGKTKNLIGESLKGKTYKSMVEILYGFNISDYLLIIRSCKQTLAFFKDKKGVYTSHYHFFLINMGLAQMITTDYKQAEDSFEKAKHYTPAKSFNDYLTRLYKTINALHAANYQTAYQLYEQSKRCKYEDIRLQFAIIEAYLCFLSHNGYLQIDKIFRLGKYLNETFKAQADKQGSNVTILIAELLVYLARDRGKFIDRVEAVHGYSYRHLKGAETRRAKSFIKILCLLPRADFNAVALQRIAAPQIKFLKDNPIHMGNNISIEIIPFGNLLDMVMQQLKQKAA